MCESSITFSATRHTIKMREASALKNLWIITVFGAATMLLSGCGGLFGEAGLGHNQPSRGPHLEPQPRVDVTNNKNAKLFQKTSNTRSKKISSTNHSPSASNPAVRAGMALFKRDCVTCHGVGGNGTNSAPRLSAPSGVASTFGSPTQLKTFIEANMPANNPGSLSSVQASNLAQYVWAIAQGK